MSTLSQNSIDRVTRHRQTEALRRRRMKAAINGIKRLLHLNNTVEQAVVLEHALSLLEEHVNLKKKLEAGTLMLIDPAQRQQLPVLHQTNPIADQSTFQPSWVHNSLNVPSMAAAISHSTNGASSSTQLPTPHNQQHLDTANLHLNPEFSLDWPLSSLEEVDPLPDLALDSMLAPLPLNKTSDELTSGLVANSPLACKPANRTSLASPFLRKSVGIFIVTQDSFGLDCNQQALDILGAPTFESIRSQWRRGQFFLDLLLVDFAFQHMFKQQSTVITILQPTRHADGSIAWARTVLTRMDDQGDVEDPAGIACSYEPTYLGVCQPASAPQDGRGRVWSDDHLLHVSDASNGSPA
eukprot:m.7604 g.7604  ORF g.7604 m.7604 type:complete len:353 (-) comp8881_c0_seq2:22-1080(-)